MEDNVHKYWVSIVLKRIFVVGLKRMVNAWNSHQKPRKGIHNIYLDIANIPTNDEALSVYRDHGGTLRSKSL